MQPNKLIVLCFLLILLCLSATGQISKVLYNLLPANARPKDINHLTSLDKRNVLYASANFNNDPVLEELRAMAIALHEEAKHTTSTKLKMDNLSAVAFFYANSTDSGIVYNKEVLQAAGTDTQYRKNMVEALINISDVYYYQGKYDSSINCLYNVLDVALALKDTGAISDIYNAYGGAFAKLQLYEKAILYDQLTLTVWEKSKLWNDTYVKNIINLITDYTNGYEDKRVRLYRDSATILLKNLMQKKKNEAPYWFESCYFLSGELQYLDGNYQQAIALFDSSMLPAYNVASKFWPNHFFECYLFKAVCLVKIGEYNKGVAILDTINLGQYHYYEKKLAYQALIEAYEKQKNYEKALAYYKKFKESSDSLNVELQLGHVYQYDESYRLLQHEAAITTLKTKNLEEKNAGLVWVTGFLCALVALLLLYVYYRGKLAKRVAETRLLADKLDLMEKEMAAKQIRQIAENKQALAEQREDISRGVHDVISGSLAALVYLIKNMRSNAVQEETKTALEDIEDEAGSIYIQTREFMHKLHKNDDVFEYDLVDFLNNLSITFGTGSSLRIETEYDKEHIENIFTPEQHTETYLFVKEAVTNCMKHSGASLLAIKTFFEKNIFHIQISDNGRGAAGANQGIGLNSMRKRIHSLGGGVSFNDSNGFYIAAKFPVG